MAKPVILTLDDEPGVLDAVESDLRRHFRGDYRILKANSGSEALAALEELKRRGQPVALFLVDQRMPEISGTEFLKQAREIFPQARKVLLTAYADTEAAISSINEVELDYYLMKPWDPPEVNMYPILDDLLSDWQANVELPYEGIRVAGTLWSARSHEVKDFLARNLIPYQWLDIETDKNAKQMVDSVTEGRGRLPVIFFPDGSTLVEPDNRQMAEKTGMHIQAAQPHYDVIILGAGPAGLGAGVYSASEGLKTLMIEKHATGGQAGTSSRIENYLGFPKGLSGADLARRATAQAKRLGAEILLTQEVKGVRVEGQYRIVEMKDGSELSCKALVIATGVSVRKLDLPGIDQFTGAGVYYGAALTEAAFYKGEHVLVVGGANSAGQGAMFFSRYASKVTLLVRGSAIELGMSQYLVDQIQSTPNIEVLTNSEVAAVYGDQKLKAIDIRDNSSGEIKKVNTPAMFIFIGAAAHTEFLQNIVHTNRTGFVVTGPDLLQNGAAPKKWRLKRDPFLLETSVPGIFAAGDVRQGAIRRVASAVGEGAIAVSFIHQYLKTV
ncbi:MAG: FAD-dependent oxidoreductase [Anaerolineales bacterium]